MVRIRLESLLNNLPRPIDPATALKVIIIYQTILQQANCPYLELKYKNKPKVSFLIHPFI